MNLQARRPDHREPAAIACKEESQMHIRSALPEDFERLSSLYHHTIGDTPGMTVHARWVYGQHPTDGMLLDYIHQGALYVLETDGGFAAAMAVTLSQGEDYREISWLSPLKDDEAAVVHILCVRPSSQGQGLGRHMVEESLRIAKEAGRKSVRLDALASNTPAHRLYEGLGFSLVGRKELYADNTGWTDFLFFEHPIG